MECIFINSILIGEQMEKIIIDHLERASAFQSILKGIPFSEENLKDAKYYVKKFFKNHKVKIRSRWRGERKHHRDHNIKSEAKFFDLYIYPAY